MVFYILIFITNSLDSPFELNSLFLKFIIKKVNAFELILLSLDMRIIE